MAEQYRLKLMERAQRDMDGIYEYIAKTLQEPGVALKLIDELESEMLSLEQLPNRCPFRQTGAYAGKDYRQLFVKNYTVIYRVDEANKTVIVVTVRYSASQF